MTRRRQRGPAAGHEEGAAGERNGPDPRTSLLTRVAPGGGAEASPQMVPAHLDTHAEKRSLLRRIRREAE